MHHITIQHIADKKLAPHTSSLRAWAKKVLAQQKLEAIELTIRLVNPEEMARLNENYRRKRGPTNVLSFPFSMPFEIEMDSHILGDIVICSAYVNKEAKEQGKPIDAHWAHMIVHGILHLLGYDHEKEKETEIMETLEIEILKKLGFANPYITKEDHTS